MNDPVNRQAYAVLRDMIFSFELAPGQRVSDFTLSKQLGISRTPVREALASLVRDGLVTAGEKGQQVRPLDADDLQDLCRLREALETMMLRLVLERGGFSPQEIAQLDACNQQIERCNEEGKIHLTFEIDEHLHDFIAQKAESPRLREQFGTVQLQMRRYRFLTLIVDGRSQGTVAEHVRLIEALRLGDLPAAEQAMRDHLRTTVQLYTQVLQRMPVAEWVRLIRNLTRPQALETLLPGAR